MLSYPLHVNHAFHAYYFTTASCPLVARLLALGVYRQVWISSCREMTRWSIMKMRPSMPRHCLYVLISIASLCVSGSALIWLFRDWVNKRKSYQRMTPIGLSCIEAYFETIEIKNTKALGGKTDLSPKISTIFQVILKISDFVKSFISHR